MAKLTPRDVIDAGGAVTDEQLEPFVNGDNDSQRKQSLAGLRRAVTGAMSFFSKLSQVDQQAEIDRPLISLGEDEPKEEKSKSTSTSRSKTRKRSSSRSKK